MGQVCSCGESNHVLGGTPICICQLLVCLLFPLVLGTQPPGWLTSSSACCTCSSCSAHSTVTWSKRREKKRDKECCDALNSRARRPYLKGISMTSPESSSRSCSRCFHAFGRKRSFPLSFDPSNQIHLRPPSLLPLLPPNPLSCPATAMRNIVVFSGTFLTFLTAIRRLLSSALPVEKIFSEQPPFEWWVVHGQHFGNHLLCHPPTCYISCRLQPSLTSLDVSVAL